MGDFRVRKIRDTADRAVMYRRALDDIQAFELMLREKVFDSGPPSIGAEQELCIIDDHFQPATTALDILGGIDDEHYTNELALFNLEVNLDPLPLNGNCFRIIEAELLRLLQVGYKQAASHQSRLLMCGILPTLKYRHLHFDYMTPIERYRTLSDALKELRGSRFEVYLQGVDELIASLDTFLFETCNTSFQLHLHIPAEEFVAKYNWAQMISGPVLAACTNSPLLLGRELWAETRVALFKQSMDTRSADKHLRNTLPRVYFGNEWLRESPAELWKNDIMRFPLILTSDELQNSPQELAAGRIPDLRAIRLHNGTTYTWNRMCYGHSDYQPHLRIECRYMPAGPSAVDEIANMALWTGLMQHEVEGEPFWLKMDFRSVRNNFVRASRYGLHTIMDWFGEMMPAKTLLHKYLIPAAAGGLERCGVNSKDIGYYLGIIDDRIQSEQTGSVWQVQNFRTLCDSSGIALAQQELVRAMLELQEQNLPVHQWPRIQDLKSSSKEKELKVEHLMSTEIFSIHEDDSIELALHIMKWNKLRHVPVENHAGDLVGLITPESIKAGLSKADRILLLAKEIMVGNPVTIEAHVTVETAIALMEQQQLEGIPVVYQNKLVGMLTSKDLAAHT